VQRPGELEWGCPKAPRASCRSARVLHDGEGGVEVSPETLASIPKITAQGQATTTLGACLDAGPGQLEQSQSSNKCSRQRA
jgi:hypothetical protein